MASPADSLVHDVRDALDVCRDTTDVLQSVEEPLFRLVRADFGALCCSLPGRPDAYDWGLWSGMRPEMFEPSGEEDVDFVRAAVLPDINRAKRDQVMIEQAALVRHPLHRRSCELGIPLRRVMAVALAESPGWHAGVTLYRADERDPFTEEDEHHLQALARPLLRTLARCREHRALSLRERLLRRLAELPHLSAAALHHVGVHKAQRRPLVIELERTEAFGDFVRTWFGDGLSWPDGLPPRLFDNLVRAARTGATLVDEEPCAPRNDVRLRATYSPLHLSAHETTWAVVLEEVRTTLSLPASWEGKLTPTQLLVAKLLLGEQAPKEIASALAISVGTVQKHEGAIYQRLGLDRHAGRIALLFKALRDR